MSNITNINDIIFQLKLITTNIYAYVGLFMFIIGTIGNVCNIVVFTRLRSLSGLASVWFLLTSFVGSQCVLSTGVLSRAIFGFTGVDPLVSSIIWCKIRWVIGPLGGTLALTCIGFASIDRYFITSRQINRHRWITMQRARYMILIAAFFWLITLIPNAIYYTAPFCTITNIVFAQFSPIFSLTVYSTAPLLVLAIFSKLTWYNLHSVSIRAVHLSSTQREVNKMMIAQICVVLLTSIPNVVIQVYTLSTRTIFKSSVRLAQEGLLTAALSMFGFTTHASTFYVYLIASRSYRNNVKNVIFRCQQQQHRVLPKMTR